MGMVRWAWQSLRLRPSRWLDPSWWGDGGSVSADDGARLSAVSRLSGQLSTIPLMFCIGKYAPASQRPNLKTTRATPMFLKIGHDDDSSLVEVLDLKQLFDPFQASVLGRVHAGEEMQDPADYPKQELRFPSGETLPRCWLDAHYPH